MAPVTAERSAGNGWGMSKVMGSPGLSEGNGFSSDRIEVGTQAAHADIVQQAFVQGVKTLDLAEARGLRTDETAPHRFPT
jgi:hypothetical protein